MIIPHRMLSSEALRSVIEACVMREGTDYGAQEVLLATKVLQVQQQLDAGTAAIVYDAETDSCTIQPTTQQRLHDGNAEPCHPPELRTALWTDVLQSLELRSPLLCEAARLYNKRMQEIFPADAIPRCGSAHRGTGSPGQRR